MSKLSQAIDLNRKRQNVVGKSKLAQAIDKNRMGLSVGDTTFGEQNGTQSTGVNAPVLSGKQDTSIARGGEAGAFSGVRTAGGGGRPSENERKKAETAEKIMDAVEMLRPHNSAAVKKLLPDGAGGGDRTWFQKGALEGGLENGNINRAVIGTLSDAAAGAAAGILGMGEQAADALAMLGAWSYGGLKPNAPSENPMKNLYPSYRFSVAEREADKAAAMDYVARDLYNERELAERFIANPIESVTGVNAGAHSILGEKSDALIQSAGQLGATAALQAVGVPWFLTTGVTSFGGEVENAANQGATFDQAAASGLISAGAEILSEKLSGGIKFGGKTLDDAIVKRIADKISDKALRNLTKIGFDAFGEGAEEVLSQVFSNLGSALYREESLGEIMMSEQALDEYLESFVGGAVLGGGSSVINTAQANAQGFDPVEAYRTDGMEVLAQAAYKMAEGKAVSNSQATAILNDRVAMEALSEATGMTVNEDMTKSQQRAAVKSAVAEIARGRTENFVSETGGDITQAPPAPNGALNGNQRAPLQRAETIREWENAQVDRASKAFGPTGREMAKAAFNNTTQNAVDYFKGFAVYYDAGLTGKDMEKVKAGTILNESQKQAAYTAGVDDAARSLARQKAGTDFVTVYGKDGGLVDNDYARGLDKEKARILNWMGKATGSKVMIVDSIADAAGRQGAANGWYENGVLKIAADATNPELVVLSHEVTHRLQEIAPEEYTRYKNYVVDIMAGAGVNVESYLDRYAQAGQNLTREQAMDEMAADFTQELLLETQSFRKLMEKDRSVAQRVLDAVKEFLAKVKAVFTGNRAAQDKAAVGQYGVDLETLERAVSLWGQALEEGQRTVQNTAGQTTSARGTMSAQYSLKEDMENGRAREEDRESFLSRTSDEGLLGGFEAGGAEYRYRELAPHEIKRGAQSVQKELNDLGVPNVVVDGELVWNRDGISGSYPVGEATTVSKKVVVINNGTSIQARNEAGHEAYHYWGESEYRKAYEETVQDNLLFNSEEFQYYQNVIYEDYFDGNVELKDKKSWNKFIEELFAYISGDIHEGTNDQYLSPMFRDYDAVKAAWEQLVRDQTKTERFSIKGTGDIAREVAALRRENEMLKERVEYYKGQTKRTTPGMVDRKAVDKAAKELITMYGADLQVSEINAELKALYDYMGVKGEVNYAEVRRRAEEIAGWIADNAVERDSEVYENYSELRKLLKETELVVSERDKGDFADWNDFRKQNFGRLRIKNGTRTNVDGVFQELEYYYPELFNSKVISHPMDQLRHIAEVADQIRTVTEHNPFSYDRASAIQGIANEILEKFFDVPQVAETFADKEARKREELVIQLRVENQERVERAVLGEKMAGGREMARFEREFREKVKKDKIDLGKAQYRREMRAKIARHAKDLSRRLVRPTDKSNVPENLRQSVALLLDSINLESDFELAARPGGGNMRVAPHSQNSAITKRTKAARQLQAAYKQILAEDGGNITIDPDLEDTLIEVASLDNMLLSDMTAEQLQTVWNAMRMVEASVTKADKAFGAGRMKTITDIGESLILDNMLIGDRGEYRPWAAGVDKLLNTDMLTPQGYFHRLGPTGDYLFKMMRESQDRHIRIMDSAQKHTKEIMKGADVRALEREMHTFDVDGEKMTMSTAQIMSLYELMKREQAKDHILLGGIRPDSADTGKGLKMMSRSKPVKMSVETIGKIVSELTDEQVKLADDLQKYMGGELAKLGNEASMEIYGYEKFKDKHYFPIKVDKNQTQRDVGKEAKGATIAGRGFTKTLTPDAKNAVMVGSIFDVYAGHVNDMATYAAWLGTMENLRRVRNYTARGENMERITDVQTVIERVMGNNGLGYLDKLMRDINQGVHTQGTGSPFDKLLGNYKAASVAANLRVVLQQPTSIFRALAEIDPKYLAKGAVKKGDWNKVQKYAPIAVWKDWGYFDVNTGRQMKDVLLDSDTWLEKTKQGGMWLAGKADSFTWARLWNAVEAETKGLRTDLKPGGEEFYKTVASRFNDIVDRTQVVDGLLQRSQIMRSPDALQKMATSYMSEPTKTYNMFVNAVYDYQRAKGTKGAKEAKGKLARTAVALTTSFAVNALAQSIMDAFRDEDKDQTWLEKFLEAYIGFAGDEESFADYWNSFWDGNLEAAFNPLGYLPYGKDLLSIMQGYDVTRMDVEPISKIFAAGQNMVKALSGESKKSVAGAATDLFAEVARLLGVPVANLKRDVMGFVNTIAGWSGSDEMQYHIERFFKNMNNSGSRKGFMDILYSANQNDREAYEYIYDDMIEHGVKPEDIKRAMEDRMKEAQGVESVEDLDQRYMSPGQESIYQGYMSGVQGSSLWRKADAGDRSALEQAAYEMAIRSKDGLKMQEKVDAGERYGVHTTEYLMYKLALEMADKPNGNGKLGSYTNDEVEEAIRMVPGLSDAARSYLWTAQGKNEKSDPWG